MNSPVEQIKERLPIEEIVSSYIKLEKTGANFKARCPFHNEKTPSFFVSPGRGNFYCFGCGAKGDIFTFVEEFEGLDFKGALKLLASRAGVMLAEYSKEREGEKERLYRAMEEATLYFLENLEGNKEVLTYLKSRGLEDETIKDFKIGFVKADWRELYTHLQKKGFTEGEMEKAGLIKKTDKGFYDRFRGRIMFPITDSSGRVIAFSGRIFIDDGKSAKYLNSPDTPIFNKSSVLYGLDRAKESIRKNNFSILVEGQMDLALSHQAGFKNTIATSGTALSEATITKDQAVSNLGLVRRLSENIVLAFDADRAGENASLRAGKIALSLGMDVKVAALPPSLDPADLIAKHGVDAWRQAIRESKHVIEFILGKVLESHTDSRKAGREIKEKVLPFVSSLESSIEKAHFLKKISDQSSIPMVSLEEDLKKIDLDSKDEQREIKEAESERVQIFRKDYIERRLAGIAFWKNDEKLKGMLKDVLSKYEDKKDDLIFEAEVLYENNETLEKDINEMLSNWEVEVINEELLRKMQELRNIKDKDREMDLLKEIQELNKKKHEKEKNKK